MTATKPPLELVSTKEIELFLPILKEIDFGVRRRESARLAQS